MRLTAAVLIVPLLQRQTVILESILHSMGDGVVVADENGRFLLLNPASQRLIGFSRKGVDPHRWAETYGFFLPDQTTPYPASDLPLSRALRGESCGSVELFVRNHEDYRTRLDPAGLETVLTIRAASQRMGQSIDDMLMLARVTRTERRCSEFDLSALVAAVAAEVRAERPEQAVTLTVEPDLIAFAGPNLIRAVLQNLLANAWKFTGKQSAGRVEFGRITTEFEPTFLSETTGSASIPNTGTNCSKLFNASTLEMSFPEQALASPRCSGSSVGMAVASGPRAHRATAQRFILLSPPKTPWKIKLSYS